MAEASGSRRSQARHAAQARLAWLEANYVTVLLTDQFLFTVHAGPCAWVQHARHQYHALDIEGTTADQARVLFLVLDVLIGSFRSQLLALLILHGGTA